VRKLTRGGGPKRGKLMSELAGGNSIRWAGVGQTRQETKERPGVSQHIRPYYIRGKIGKTVEEESAQTMRGNGTNNTSETEGAYSN